ncbi:MAG: cytochrome c [Candidatus Binataceae bacterium]
MLKRIFFNAVTLSAAYVALLGMVSSHAWADDAGKQAYDDRCASCHGASGKGDGAAAAAFTPKIEAFSKSLTGKSDDWIAKVTKEGGPAVGLPATMPPASDLSDAQLKSVVAYVKQLAK